MSDSPQNLAQSPSPMARRGDKRATAPAAGTTARESAAGGIGAPADFAMPDLPAEMFSPPGMLAIADVLPVMTAYVDKELRYRFLNKPLADWFERPRSEILGKTLKEVLGKEAFAVREPMLRAALAGERQYFASDFDHPTRGPLAVQTNYVPWVADDGKGGAEVKGLVIVVADVTEQRATERAL